MTELEVDFDKNVTNLYQSISESNWDQAIEDVKSNPEEARTWVVRHSESGNGEIMWRFLPIHSACARQPPDTLISALLGAYSQGAQCADDQGMLPIHYACGNQASIDVIRLLLLASPTSAATADPNGMLPIHYLAQWGPSSPSVINVVLFSNSEVVNARDLEGNTPLDLAREGDYNERDEVIFALEQFSHGAEDSRPIEKQNHQPQQQMSINGNPSSYMLRDQTHDESNDLDRERIMTMPKTSQSVRRLQEATAAQKKLRDEHSKGKITDNRDDTMMNLMTRSAFNTQPRDSSNMHVFRSVPSSEELSQIDSGNASTMKMISSLKAEVDKLRAEASLAEAEAEEKINNERDAMQATLDEMKGKLGKAQQETMDSLAELTAKEEFGQYVEARLQDKENVLSNAVQKNEKLKKDLSSVKKSIIDYKAKTSQLDGHLATLSNSMNSMMQEQEMIMKASIRHEEHMKKVAIVRQQKMQELIDQEVEFARMSLEKQKESELGSEEMINEALEKQKNLMSAVAAVLNESAAI
jgi:hypothetical protein